MSKIIVPQINWTHVAIAVVLPCVVIGLFGLLLLKDLFARSIGYSDMIIAVIVFAFPIYAIVAIRKQVSLIIDSDGLSWKQLFRRYSLDWSQITGIQTNKMLGNEWIIQLTSASRTMSINLFFFRNGAEIASRVRENLVAKAEG